MTKAYILRPSHGRYWHYYLIGLVLAPLLIGLWWIYRTWAKVGSTSYQITDRAITLIKGAESVEVALENIKNIHVATPWTAKLARLSDLRVETVSGAHYLAEGIQDAEEIAKLILTASEALRNQKERLPQPKIEAAPAGTLEPLNDLVGMWQQGLLTDDEYETERRKWEKN